MLTGTITGWPETERLLESIISEATRNDVLAAALLRAAEPIVEIAQQHARRRSGAMAASIAAKRVDEGADQVLVQVGADTNRPHWQLFHLHELGTVKKAAQPMVRPAWDEVRPAFPEKVASEIRPAFDRAAQSHERSSRNGR